MNSPLQTHLWRQREVLINGVLKREFFCTRCKRRFIEIENSGQFIAAFPSAVDYEPLAPDVTVKWLNEPCPGRQLKADIAAYENRPRPKAA